MNLEKQVRYMRITLIAFAVLMIIAAFFVSCKPAEAVLCSKPVGIESVTPSDGESGVPLTTNVIVKLKEKPSPELLDMLCTDVIPMKGSKYLKYDIKYDGDRSVVISFEAPLKKDSVYQIYIFLEDKWGRQQYLDTTYFSTRW